MKNAEAIGNLIGSIIGALLTGVCIYFTKSVFSGLIAVVCFYIGGSIGKEIDKSKSNK